MEIHIFIGKFDIFIIIDKIFNKDIILTYSIYFLGCLLLLSKNRRNAKDANISGTSLKNIFVRDFYIKSASIRGIYVSSLEIVKRLKIYLQFFLIMKVEDV